MPRKVSSNQEVPIPAGMTAQCPICDTKAETDGTEAGYAVRDGSDLTCRLPCPGCGRRIEYTK